ncbi:MAG: transporter [Rhizomicrobium sp.]|nr:transporter [Rhizomicrobium sp.]
MPHPGDCNILLGSPRWATLLLSAALMASAAANAQDVPDAAVRDQWFTGSLEAPSPALSKAGAIAVEPYVIYTTTTGAYDAGWSQHGVVDGRDTVRAIASLSYGITDRLTLHASPTVSHAWNNEAGSSGVGDLPVELKYRFNDENKKTGWPSVTLALGVTLPIGRYDHLSSSVDGIGSGAYTLKEGLLFQSLFDTPGNHPVRLRFYAAGFEPLDHVSVRDLSTFGTANGFRGTAMPGFAAQFGIGAGYALDQQWVLALDLVQDCGNGYRLSGTDALDRAVQTHSANSARLSIAPAVEFNWSSKVGVIIGVEFSATGRNTASYVAPQIALSVAL